MSRPLLQRWRLTAPAREAAQRDVALLQDHVDIVGWHNPLFNRGLSAGEALAVPDRNNDRRLEGGRCWDFPRLQQAGRYLIG